MELSNRAPRALRGGDQLHEVYALVKENMASKCLSQDPLLVLPSLTLEESQRFLERASATSCPTVSYSLEDARIQDLKVLRNGISKDFPHKTRTLAWYDAMINRTPGPRHGHVPKLTFFQRASIAHRNEVHSVGRLDAIPAGPRPVELQVVFHRAH